MPLKTVNPFSTVSRLMMLLAPAMLLAAAMLLFGGCDKPKEGSPEAVADAFVDAYFRRADQAAAKQYTALGASRMLDKEIEDVSEAREDGYSPAEASLDVSVERGARSMRGKRVRFDYELKFKDSSGERIKHADVELTRLDDEWKVVRIGRLSDAPAPPAAS
jgi:hypothetical protein